MCISDMRQYRDTILAFGCINSQYTGGVSLVNLVVIHVHVIITN